MSSDLSWIPYIYEITFKARQKAAWVLSVFYSRSEAIMLTVYKSMVHSLLEYCCPLWSPESVQKVFTSNLSGMPELIYWQRPQSLQRRQEPDIIFHMWKILNKKTSNDLKGKFVFRLRLGNQAKIPSFKKNSSAFNWAAYERSPTTNLIRDMDVCRIQLNEFSLSVPDTPPVRSYTFANLNSLLYWRKEKEASASWSGHQRRLY